MASNTQKSPGEILGPTRYVYPETNDFGWRDITADILTRGVGATDPAWTQIGSSSFYAYAFAVNDVAWFNYHIPHDIVPNCPIHFHAHWLTDGTDSAIVKWQWEFMYAKGFNQAAFNTTGTTVTAQQAGSGVAFQHMVTETEGNQIDGLTEPDGIIQCKITRVTNGAVDNADSVFLLTADIHYQSTSMATFGKAPNFYGQ